mmetsp:Transcript_2246/g.4277  ORF Transcript_2246/g.4277 Transcript_2246/m.4277 type:complete len:87 (-) Transcript_2246:739-999(-)
MTLLFIEDGGNGGGAVPPAPGLPLRRIPGLASFMGKPLGAEYGGVLVPVCCTPADGGLGGCAPPPPYPLRVLLADGLNRFTSGAAS